MPRRLRVEYPGAIYHVMDRGDRREDIFHDEVDRYDFLKTLAETCHKTGFQIHAYCMLGNHFHLVLETPQANLVEGMRWFLSAFTLRMNHRRKLFGHVFSGRYKAILIDGSGNGYLRTACDYVHLNPVRANLIGKNEPLLAYPWSSYPWYLSAARHRPPWCAAKPRSIFPRCNSQLQWIALQARQSSLVLGVIFNRCPSLPNLLSKALALFQVPRWRFGWEWIAWASWVNDEELRTIYLDW